jgi:hypothetical protein
MDRENSLTLLLPEWGSIPIPSDPQSRIQPIAPQARGQKEEEEQQEDQEEE